MAGQFFSVGVRPDRERLIVEVHGEIDLLTAPRVREAVAEAVASGWSQLVIDRRAVSFMDSAGVHLLLRPWARTASRVR